MKLQLRLFGLFGIFALSPFLVAAAPPPPTVEIVKLSPEILGTSGSVREIGFAQCGATALFIANFETRTKTELFAMPTAGGMPRKLNGPEWYSVSRMAILPDGERVLYSGSANVWVVDLRTGARTPLGGASTDDRWWVAPDGEHVTIRRRLVRIADAAIVAELPEFQAPLFTHDKQWMVITNHSISGQQVLGSSLQAVRIETGAIHTIYETPEQWAIQDFALSADSRSVFFLESQLSSYDQALRRIKRVAIAGGQAELVVTGAYDFQLGPVGDRVVFRQIASTGYSLFSIAPGDPLPVNLASDFTTWDFQISPDGSRVVYSRILNPEAPAAERILRLYSIPISGGAAVALFDLPFAYDRSWSISPSGKYVCGQAHYAPIAGGNVRPLPDLSSGDSRFTANDEWLFRIGVDIADPSHRTDCSAIRLEDGALVHIDQDLPNSSFRPRLILAPPVGGMHRALYCSSYFMRIGDAVGSRTTLLDSSVPWQRDNCGVRDYRIDPIAGRVFFDASNVEPELELSSYSNSVEGGDLQLIEQQPADAHLAMPPDPPNNAYQGSTRSKDGRWGYMYYTPVRDEGPLKYAGYIYSTVTSGTVYNADIGNPGGYIKAFRFSPDSRTAAVVTQKNSTTDPAVLSIIDLAGGTVRQVPPFSAGALEIQALQPGGLDPTCDFSPDSSTLLIRARTPSRGFELYAVKLSDLSWRKLSGDLAATDDVTMFTVAPDSTSAVYQVRNLLFTVPLDSGPPLALNAAEWGTLIGQFQFHPTYRCLLFIQGESYLAKHMGDLWAAPLDGGSPVKLNGPRVKGRGAIDFKTDPVSGIVIYRADSEQSAAELFAAKFLATQPYPSYDLPRSAVHHRRWDAYR